MRISIKFLLLAVLFLFLGCEDIIEEDISNDTVQLITPQDEAEIFSNAVTFQWNEVAGASKYRLQVYSENNSIVVDSLISNSGFTHALDPGTYQWRIRGENFAYSTEFTFPLSFSVFESTDLSSHIVFLSNPSEALFTNSSEITFNWQPIEAAMTYDFQMINTTNSQVVHSQTGMAESTYTIENNVINGINAEYQWKVRAVNATSQSAYASRTIKFDNVNPNSPQNQLPVSNTIVSVGSENEYTWTVPTDSGVIQSPLSYVIEFASDISFSTIVHSDVVNVPSYSHTLAIIGDYYWRVKAHDAAGNQGSFSTFSKVTVQ